MNKLYFASILAFGLLYLFHSFESEQNHRSVEQWKEIRIPALVEKVIFLHSTPRHQHTIRQIVLACDLELSIIILLIAKRFTDPISLKPVIAVLFGSHFALQFLVNGIHCIAGPSLPLWSSPQKILRKVGGFLCICTSLSFICLCVYVCR